MSPNFETRIVGGQEVVFVKDSKVSDGSIYMLVRGWFGSSKTFSNWLEMFARNNVAAGSITLPVGKSTTFREYVSRVASVLRELRKVRRPIILVGYSFGGLISQVVLSENPDLADGLVLVNSAPPKGISHVEWFWFRPEYVWEGLIKGDLFCLKNEDIESYFLNRIALIDRAKAKRISDEFLPESGKVARTALTGIPVGAIDMPMMVIASTHDKVLPAPMQLKIAQRYGAIYREFPHDHLLPVTDDGQAVQTIIAMGNIIMVGATAPRFVRVKASPRKPAVPATST